MDEFTEVESGKRNDRPELEKALAACKRQKAKLVIAKLDRLGRNLAFIAALMESGVEFVAVDNPHANKLTVHILAAVAQHEREMISERTTAALAAAKRRGQRLGNPNLTEVAKRGTATGKANARRFAANVHPIIEEIMSGELAKLRQRVGDNQPTTLRKPLEVCPGFGQSEPSPPILQFATSGRLTSGTKRDYKENMKKPGPTGAGFFRERLADHNPVFGLAATATTTSCQKE